MDKLDPYEELWKPVKGYEGLYEVSNYGNVRGLATRTHNGYGSFIKSGKLLRPTTDKDGYLVVGLRDRGRNKTAKVHRLVAEAFIPNPNGFLQINHKDEDKSNNCVSNLEWCTNTYNLNYGHRSEKAGKTLRHVMKSKKLYQFDLDGNLLRIWPSIHEMQRQLGFSRSNVKNCAMGNYKQSYGYKWILEDKKTNAE